MDVYDQRQDMDKSIFRQLTRGLSAASSDFAEPGRAAMLPLRFRYPAN
jgi:hypothetical protein